MKFRARRLAERALRLAGDSRAATRQRRSRASSSGRAAGVESSRNRMQTLLLRRQEGDIGPAEQWRARRAIGA